MQRREPSGVGWRIFKTAPSRSVICCKPPRAVPDELPSPARLANASDYGLGGTVWTTDHDRGVEVAKRVQTGSIGINNYLPDPTAPFGGVKSSGMGRELGPEGLAAYLNFKSIYLPVKLQPVSPEPIASGPAAMWAHTEGEF